MIGGAILALVGGLLAAVFGLASGLFFVGLIVGLLTVLVGILLVAVPRGHSVWGSLAIVFAFVSIPFALGGFVVGFVLALIGGILGLLWRPPRTGPVITVHAWTPPPPPP